MSPRYLAVVSELYALAPSGMILGLGPVRAALAHFNDPQRRFRTAHITGTNGKGSTSAFVSEALRAADRRVGLYTSPHLHRFNERIRVDGAPCDDGLLGDALWDVFAARDAGAIPPLTLFEAATVAGWLVFEASAVSDVVLEVGVGGRHDATNVCDPAVCAITRVALDHQALIGPTIREIAFEKAGILKTGVPVVLGPALAAGEGDPVAREVIERVAREVGAPVLESPPATVLSLDRDARATVAFGGPDPFTVTLGLAGAHQVENARTAVAILRQLGVAREHIAAGLSAARWPARCERVDNVLIDSAHNPDGVRALRAVLALDTDTPVERRALVFGASRDKDWREGLDLLEAWCPPSQWFLCAANLSRAAEPELLATHRGGAPCASVADAVARARALAGPHGRVVVCGSIFVAAAARAELLGVAQDPPLGL
jgi:dihydrofolate synthase/folylpolyglutamate synthase